MGFKFEDHLPGKFLDVSVLAFTLGLYFLSIPLEFVPLTTGASISKYVAVLPLTAAFLNLKNLRFRNRWLTASMPCLALITLGSGLVSPLHIPFSNYIALLINIAFTVLLGFVRYVKKRYRVSAKVPRGELRDRTGFPFDLFFYLQEHR